MCFTGLLKPLHRLIPQNNYQYDKDLLHSAMAFILHKLKINRRFLSKQIPYPYTWVNVLAISALLGGMQVFITIFLEPFGTAEFDAPYRNLRLSGYILCFIIPFFLFFSGERFIYKFQNKKWYLYQEIISKTLLCLIIITACYFYNITVINSISPSFSRWLNFTLMFAWPYLLVLIPLVIVLYKGLLKNKKSTDKPVAIVGENKGDRLDISEQDFIYAESYKNYVTIFYLEQDQLREKVIRSSLKAVDDQITSSMRIHRSYLINPLYLKEVKGNKRRQFAILHHTDTPLPVSSDIDKDELIEASR